MRTSTWGDTIAILLLVLIDEGFPLRYVFGTNETREAFTIALWVVLVMSALANVLRVPWHLRNIPALVATSLMSAFNALTLYQLIFFMVIPDKSRPELDGVCLLASAVSIWLTNVLAFALLYWVVDGGGPESRALDPQGKRDFAFPGDMGTPNFADYTFLAFNAATAFSPTDTSPLTTRVRMMMLMESSISLLAIAIAAARAVNILH